MAEIHDTPELEALFDSIASAQSAPPPSPPPPTTPVRAAGGFVAGLSEGAGEIGDSDELQALFDSVADKNETAASVESVGAQSVEEKTFNRIGQLARQLHDALLGLGYDKVIEKTVNALPDAKDRLAYVANLTEQAACRVLNATDIAMPLQERLESKRMELALKWDRVYANQVGVADFKKLADETRTFLNHEMAENIAKTNAQLMEIMMAQDFQDLTGQVIKKIVVLAQEMESSIMTVLIDIIPEIKRTDEVNTLLNGPVVNSDGRSDVVVDQTQVDDLLGSLGF